MLAFPSSRNTTPPHLWYSCLPKRIKERGEGRGGAWPTASFLQHCPPSRSQVTKYALKELLNGSPSPTKTPQKKPVLDAKVRAILKSTSFHPYLVRRVLLFLCKPRTHECQSGVWHHNSRPPCCTLSRIILNHLGQVRM